MPKLVIDETLLNAILTDAMKVIAAEEIVKRAKKEAIANFKKNLNIDDPNNTLFFVWVGNTQYLSWTDSKRVDHSLEIDDNQKLLLSKIGISA